MNLRRVWQSISRADPALVWIREKDAPRAKATLVRISIVFLLLIPIFAVQPRVYDSTRLAQPEMNPSGLIFGVLAFGLATLLAVHINRPLFVRRPLLEMLAWLMLVILVGSGAYVWALAKVGGGDLIKPQVGTALLDILDPLTKFFAASHLKSAIVAWISAACAALAMLFSTRGLAFKPSLHAYFVAACVGTTIVGDPAFQQNHSAVAFMLLAGVLTFAVNRGRYRIEMQVWQAHCATSDEHTHHQSLLSSFISGEVHERLKRNERVADSFSNLTVMFADMVGFTDLSRRVSPGHLVDLLNEVFEAGDEIAREAGIEKVKTIGDCYMAGACGISSADRGAADVISFAKRYLRKVEEVSQRLDIPLALRAGIHTGPAVGGIIGVSRPAYDYWGETVNLASRLEGASGAGRILVSESTWLQTKRDFAFEVGCEVDIKGVGTVRAFLVAHDAQAENVLPLRQRSP